MSSSQQRARLWTLYRRYPYCWWCGRKVRKFRLPPGVKLPRDYATLDHLNSRNMYPAGRPNLNQPGRVTTLVTVLACARCNRARGDAELLGRDWVPPLLANRGG